MFLVSTPQTLTVVRARHARYLLDYIQLIGPVGTSMWRNNTMISKCLGTRATVAAPLLLYVPRSLQNRPSLVSCQTPQSSALSHQR